MGVRAQERAAILVMAPQMTDTDICAQSPCVRDCCLDDDLICLGCFRSMEEIKEWTVVDENRRRDILRNAMQRRAERQTLSGR